MNDEPKKQEPEIMPPGPNVEPERPGPKFLLTRMCRKGKVTFEPPTELAMELILLL